MEALYYRKTALALIAALPTAVQGLRPTQRHRPPEEWLGCERLEVELQLAAQTFCISHSLAKELQDCAVLECRFGALPKERGLEAMRRLLALNLQCATTSACGFGWDDTRGEILLSTHVNLDHITPEVLARRIEANALLAAHWRDEHFLGPPLPAELVSQLMAAHPPIARA